MSTRRRFLFEGNFQLFVVMAILAAPTAGCTSDRDDTTQPGSTGSEDAPSPRAAVQEYDRLRTQMISEQLVARDIVDRRVLEAMDRVPRHEFVPERERDSAYLDQPLPIGYGQTISQPYIVALMTQMVEPKPEAKALDIGTGSGYQAAVLAELVEKVYSIEIVKPLADDAKDRLYRLEYQNIEVRHGDGYRGWPEEAPFDVIIVAAAADHVPPALVEQLARGGKLVIPVGKGSQDLLVVEKSDDGAVGQRKVATVAFVPMTGEQEAQ